MTNGRAFAKRLGWVKRADIDPFWHFEQSTAFENFHAI
jgi:hypothetical protein